jgi:hypothetical protein
MAAIAKMTTSIAERKNLSCRMPHTSQIQDLVNLNGKRSN